MVGSVMVPTLDASNDTILPGDTAIFSFDIGNAVNWSFEYTYSINGDTFTDLLATDVPEPNSFGLFAVALGASLLVRRRIEFRSHKPRRTSGRRRCR